MTYIAGARRLEVMRGKCSLGSTPEKFLGELWPVTEGGEKYRTLLLGLVMDKLATRILPCPHDGGLALLVFEDPAVLELCLFVILCDAPVTDQRLVHGYRHTCSTCSVLHRIHRYANGCPSNLFCNCQVPGFFEEAVLPMRMLTPNSSLLRAPFLEITRNPY